MTREELLSIAKPILFNTEMVKAILEGKKGATRRVIKKLSDGVNRIEQGDFGTYEAIFGSYNNDCFAEMYQVITPPFKIGDYLYVRETWTDWSCSECEGDCIADNGNGHCTGAKYLYKADGEIEGVKWKPSIHMPKEAARIFLKIMHVRVERLQDMDEDDAIQEGIHPKMCPNCSGLDCDLCSESEYTVMDEFMYLWNSTIKKADLDKYGWEANPWVWVIEFEKVEV